MKDIKELREAYPELVAEIENNAKAGRDEEISGAVQAERKRLQDIDGIAGSIGDAEMLNEAKYGEKACTAPELAMQAMQKQAKLGEKFLKDRAGEAKKTNGVEPSPEEGDGSPESMSAQSTEQMQESIREIVQQTEKAMGVRKNG